MSVPAHTKVESLEDRVTRLERIVSLLAGRLEQNPMLSYPEEAQIVELANKLNNFKNIAEMLSEANGYMEKILADEAKNPECGAATIPPETKYTVRP